jgi:hypothetical protein
VSDGYLDSTYADGWPDDAGRRFGPRRRQESRRAKAEVQNGYDRLPHLNEKERRRGPLGPVAVLAAVVTLLWFYLPPYLGDLLSGGL